jgi:polysaccharide export outer membrane protein
MRYFILTILSLSLITSCKTANIFQVENDKDKAPVSFEMLDQNYEHVLAPDDKLSLSIWNHDDLSIGSVYSIYNTNESFGKWILIESDSTAAISYAGSLKLAALTINKAEKLIAEKLSEFIKNPIIELRVLNREITILGEVNAPGNYLLEKELNTLVEFIGKAQGLSFYADSKKNQIISNEVSYAVDLTSLDGFQQKNIYLQARDIIYIPSKKGKK